MGFVGRGPAENVNVERYLAHGASASRCPGSVGVRHFAVRRGPGQMRQVSDNAVCPLCRGKQTLEHVLSTYKVVLEQGRFPWRHKMVLKELGGRNGNDQVAGE